MKTMKYYYDLYLQCDGLSLADVPEKFRNSSLKNYGLRPSYQLSAPDLGWDGDKDGRALYKLLNNPACAKTMENLRNRIDVNLVNNEKDYLKCTSKPSNMSHKIFDNNLVPVLKSFIKA